MSSNIFLTIAIVTTGIFAVQFILSIFFNKFYLYFNVLYKK